MRNRFICLLATVAAIAVLPSRALAVRQYVVSPDPVKIPVSIDGETVIQMPSDIVKVLRPSGTYPFDMLPPMGNVMVLQVPEVKRQALKMSPKPYTLTLVTRRRIQQLILVPIPGLPQRIEFVEKKEKARDPNGFEGSSNGDEVWVNVPYKRMIRKLILSLYKGVPPRGFRMAEATSDPSLKLNTNHKGKGLYYEPPQFTADYRMDLKRVVAGKSVVGRLYVVSNTTDMPIRLSEQMFWREGCMAIAVRNHRLLPRTPATERTGQYQTEVYVIAKRKSAPVGSINAAIHKGRLR